MTYPWADWVGSSTKCRGNLYPVKTTIRLALLGSVLGILLLGQTSVPSEEQMVVKALVAPAYPRAAKDRRIQGRTVNKVTVSRDGTVKASR